MKKALVIALTLIAGAKFVSAQDGENNLKNFRFGLVAAPSLNWYKPEDAKKISNDGIKPAFGWGLQMEFRLNNVASLATGLQINYDRGNMNFMDTANFIYDTREEGYLAPEDTAGQSYVFYKLNNRVYKTNYVTLPLYLKMKTNEIGMMTYFGEFGLNSSFRLKSKTDDNVTQYTTNFPTADLTAVDNTKDMNLFRFQLHIGGGFEYNLSGSTSFFTGLSFNYGFSNVMQQKSEYLRTNDNVQFKQQATANNIALTVGILF